MTYTRHGHQITGTIAEEPRPSTVVRCGGPRICTQCAIDAAAALGPLRADREGDTQPLPIPSDAPIAHMLVRADLLKRLSVGIERYGQPLQPHNGRDSLQDAYEEALGLCVYLRNAIYERDNPQ